MSDREENDVAESNPTSTDSLKENSEIVSEQPQQHQQPQPRPTQPPQVILHKEGKGVVKAVPSGDTVILLLTDHPYPPPEKEITLSSLTAPRLARLDPKTNTLINDDKFAWDSREFLRSKIIGRTAQYFIENKNPSTGREYGLLRVNGENIVDLVATAGWARVYQPPGGQIRGHLQDISQEAEKEGRGIFNKDPVAQEKSVRKIVTKFDRNQRLDLFERIKNQTLDAFVDQVRNGSLFRVWITEHRNGQKLWYNLLVRVAGVQSPGLKYDSGKPDAREEPFYNDAKFFSERRLLHRWVKITFTTRGIDKNIDTFIGKVMLGDHSIAEALVKEGLAEFIDVHAVKEDEKNLRALENLAKEQKLRIWKDYTALPASTPTDSNPNEYYGKVRQIISCTTIVVEETRGKTKELKNITLSSITPPSLEEKEDIAKFPTPKEREEAGKFLRWEGREFLRNKLIGKKVHLTLDYSREVPSEQSRGLVSKSYYTVITDKENVAVSLVEQGLASVANHRNNDKRSPFYDALIKAEKTAKQQGKGKFAKVIPGLKITDLTSNPSLNQEEFQKEIQVLTKKAKNFKAFLMKGARLPAIVEFVQGPGRFKIFIPKENCIISFALSGISTVSRMNERQKALYVKALEFTRSKINQRNVEILVEDQDKTISFLGSLFINKKDFSVTLLENGYAQLRPTAERLTNFEAMQKAEDDAKRSRLHIWHDYVEDFHDEEQVQVSQPEKPRQEYIRAEVTEIVDGNLFYIHIKGDELAALDSLMQRIQAAEKTPLPGFVPFVHQKVLAKFSQDNNWYRAEVCKISNGQYTVFYVDFGNSEILPAHSLYPIEPEFTKLPPQAKPSHLAYIKVPTLKEEFGKEASEYLGELVWNKLLFGSVEYREKDHLFLTLGDPETNVLVSAAIVRNGLARVEKRANPKIPTVAKLKEEEEYAKRSHQYIWQYGDISDDEDEQPGRGRGKKIRRGKK